MEGRDVLLARKAEILANPNLLDTEFGGKDMPEFRNNLIVNAPRYDLGDSDYEVFCIKFLIDFLTIPEVWDAVEKFADTILEKADEKMDEQALSEFFDSSGYDDFLKTKAKGYLLQIHYKKNKVAGDGQANPKT